MAEARIRFNRVGLLAYATSSVFAIVTALLTLLLEWSRNELFLPLIFPLMPGVIAGLLITGGHGGTKVQESAAPYVAALVNAAFYFLAIVVCMWIWRALISRPTAYTHNAPKDNIHDHL